jgi:RHS repeat-associated protein
MLLTIAAFGQDTQNTQNTVDQNMRSSGRVNPSTLGMEFDLPLGSYPGRGISMPLGINYSSKQWRFEDDESIQLPGAPKYIFAVAKFSENAAAGWTSSLTQPYIEYTGKYNRFDDYGRPLPGEQLGGGQTSPPGDNYIRRITVFLPGGASYELRASDAPTANPNNLNYPPESVWEGTFYSTDGSGVKYVQDSAASPAPIFRLYMPDGSYYDFNVDREQKSSTDFTEVRRGTRLTDVHGNYIQFNAPNERDGYPNGSWTDQLGRTFPIMVPRETPTLAENETVFEQSFHMPGIDQSYILRWKPLLGESGRQSDSALTDVGSQVLHYAGTTSLGQAVTPSLFTSGMRTRPCLTSSSFLHLTVPSGVKFNPVVLTEIVLPTGAKYKFTYNEFGEVERIHYPTGGREEIDYDPVPSLAHLAPPYQQANRGVAERRIYESDGDSTSDKWKFSAAASDNNYRTSAIAPDATRTDTFMHRGVPTPTCAQENTTGYGLNYFGTRWGFDNILSGKPYDIRRFSSTGHVMQRTLTRYAAATTSVELRLAPSLYVQRNSRPITSESITYDGDTGLSNAIKLGYDADVDGYGSPQNVVSTKEYAFTVVSGGNSISPDEAPPASAITLSDPTASGTVMKISETDYLNTSTDGALAALKTACADNNLLRVPIASKVKNSSGTMVTQIQIIYDQTGSSPELGRGLPTLTKIWDSNKGVVTDPANYVSVSAAYDTYGNRISSTDAKGFTTTTDYDSTYQAYPSSVTKPIPDDGGTHGSATALVASATFDPVTGRLLTQTDANNNSIEMTYDGNTGRLTSVEAPNGHLTQYYYGTPDSDGRLSASERYLRVKSQIDEVKWDESFAWFDGLGRNIKVQNVNSNGDIFTETEYDAMGNVKKASNPYRTGETVLKTENFFDDFGRLVKTKTPDNAEIEMIYGLSTSGGTLGFVTTIEDQADKVRRKVTDARGNLIRVDEPTDSGGLGTVASPNQSTAYTYDLLNNLTSVTQGSQTRTYSYSSLSRLLSAVNPESGSISYTYDNNGNLATRTDARNVVTTYAYDRLDRVITKTYSGETDYATPTASYFYDNLTNARGKLIKIDSSISTTEYFGFDVMGKPASHKQTTDSTQYTTAYTYNLGGDLIEETYPSTRKVKKVLDSNGDLMAVKSSKNSAAGYWTYADAMAYNAAGALTKLQLGNGHWESTAYNNRFQPTQIALGTLPGAANLLKLDYAYGKWESGTLNNVKNNGSVGRQIITVGTAAGDVTFTQKYDYDALNRIVNAAETNSANQETWREAYTYDRYGNRNFNETYTTTLTRSCGASPNFAVCAADRKVENPSISGSTNRIVQDQDGDSVNDYIFDAVGNTSRQADGTTYIYNGENKLVEAKNASGTPIGQYYYDGDGRRVKKYVPATGELTVFVYDAADKVVAEYSTVTTSKPEVSYLTNDNLGTPRINTNESGAVVSRHDYRPFGEEIVTGGRAPEIGYNADSVRKQFTGYEHDAEIDLDFAQARYFSPQLGRFSTPDKFTNDSNTLDPQSWNLYAYVRNNPLSYTDPSGEEVYVVIGGQVLLYRIEDGKGKLYAGKNEYKGEDGAAAVNVMEGLRGTNPAFVDMVLKKTEDGSISTANNLTLDLDTSTVNEGTTLNDVINKTTDSRIEVDTSTPEAEQNTTTQARLEADTTEYLVSNPEAYLDQSGYQKWREEQKAKLKGETAQSDTSCETNCGSGDPIPDPADTMAPPPATWDGNPSGIPPSRAPATDPKKKPEE